MTDFFGSPLKLSKGSASFFHPTPALSHLNRSARAD